MTLVKRFLRDVSFVLFGFLNNGSDYDNLTTLRIKLSFSSSSRKLSPAKGLAFLNFS